MLVTWIMLHKCPCKVHHINATHSVTLELRVAIFPGKYAYFPDGGKYWEIPGNMGNTGKYKGSYYKMLEVDQIRY